MRGLIVALAFWGLASSAGADEPYAFWGHRLGASLEEIEAAPPSAAGGDKSEAALRCMNFQDNALRWCEWRRDGYPMAPPLGVGDATVEYRFVRDGLGVMRLYEMSLVSESANERVAMAGLVERNGDPTRSSTSVARAGIGVEVRVLTATWENDVSTITLRSPAASIDAMVIDFRHTELARIADGTRPPSASPF